MISVGSFSFETLLFSDPKNIWEIETLHFVPKGLTKKTNFKLIVYIHGHNTTGAWQGVQKGKVLSENGFHTLLVSQPGYGNSTGPKDFCGPATVTRLAETISAFQDENDITPDQTGVWGISRGATVASMIACSYPGLAHTFVIQSGAYDLKRDYEWPQKNPGIKANMEKEMGGSSDTAFKDRSALFHIDTVQDHIVIVHGADDDNISVDQAKNLYTAAQTQGKHVELNIIDGCGHLIPDTIVLKRVLEGTFAF